MYYEIYVKGVLYEVVYDTQEIIKMTCDLIHSGVNDNDIKIVTIIDGVRFNN